MMRILVLLLALQVTSICAQEEKVECRIYWINEEKSEMIQVTRWRFMYFHSFTKEDRELAKDHPRVQWLIKTKEFKRDFPDYPVVVPAVITK